jgi:hypothetical protein
MFYLVFLPLSEAGTSLDVIDLKTGATVGPIKPKPAPEKHESAMVGKCLLEISRTFRSIPEQSSKFRNDIRTIQNVLNKKNKK